MSKSEAQTRSELIDQQLSQSGWNVKDPTQVIEEFDILTAMPHALAMVAISTLCFCLAPKGRSSQMERENK